MDLARTLIRLSGMAESEVKIVFTGLRAGEKLSEELFYAAEEQKPTPVGKVLRTSSRPPSAADLRRGLLELAAAMRGSTGGHPAVHEGHCPAVRLDACAPAPRTRGQKSRRVRIGAGSRAFPSSKSSLVASSTSVVRHI